MESDRRLSVRGHACVSTCSFVTRGKEKAVRMRCCFEHILEHLFVPFCSLSSMCTDVKKRQQKESQNAGNADGPSVAGSVAGGCGGWASFGCWILEAEHI